MTDKSQSIYIIYFTVFQILKYLHTFFWFSRVFLAINKIKPIKKFEYRKKYKLSMTSLSWPPGGSSTILKIVHMRKIAISEFKIMV